MSGRYSRAWVEVDLAAYRHNLREVARHTGTRVLAVVKANGYGHGMVPIARAAIGAGAAFLGVALVSYDGGWADLVRSRAEVRDTVPETTPVVARKPKIERPQKERKRPVYHALGDSGRGVTLRRGRQSHRGGSL